LKFETRWIEIGDEKEEERQKCDRCGCEHPAEDLIEEGGAKREEIARRFSLRPDELENEFAILRHCELVKGQKREDGVYIVPFED